MKTNVYKLVGDNDEKSVLSIQNHFIKIDGNIPESGKNLIEQLSQHLKTSDNNISQEPTHSIKTENIEVLEGEVLGKGSHQNHSQQERLKSQFQAQFKQFQWKNLPLKSKLKLGLFMMVAIPLLLILIPIAIVFTIIRVLIFKCFHR